MAAENRPGIDGKFYASPSSPAELEAWLNATFITSSADSWQSLWHNLVKTRQMTMYYLPKAGQLFIQGEHCILDGRGIVNFWDRFFRALGSPLPLQELMRTDGSDIARLPPRSDDLLDTSESRPGRGEQRAHEILAPFGAMTAPITMPVASPLPPRSDKNGAMVFKATRRATDAIRAQCKTQRLSVTAAWHAAVVLATQSIQAEHGAAGTQFATFGNFDVRRYFPRPSSQPGSYDYALGNHHCVLPYIVTASKGRTLPQLARELGAFYQRDLAKSDPEVWSALGPMVRILVPDFVKEQLDETTPAVSSFGVLDDFISHEYPGGWAIEDLWLGDTVTGPWLEHFMWSWKGQLWFNTCYNPAYYKKEDVDRFNRTVLDRMMSGLGATGRPDEKL